MFQSVSNEPHDLPDLPGWQVGSDVHFQWIWSHKRFTKVISCICLMDNVEIIINLFTDL